jgi:hypothetical protein
MSVILHWSNLNDVDNCAALQLKTLMDCIWLLEIRPTLFMKFTARGDTRAASVVVIGFPLKTPCGEWMLVKPTRNV